MFYIQFRLDNVDPLKMFNAFQGCPRHLGRDGWLEFNQSRSVQHDATVSACRDSGVRNFTNIPVHFGVEENGHCCSGKDSIGQYNFIRTCSWLVVTRN